ncbi:M48 family metallopeptidase [Methylocapsa sp. S129]|uniref:M48 family metallopeptidase n=1 Tax=Methylocapsa sp. S129 TaxID=1641869 RepID=UPI00131A7705|nr:M48 family metallopeptidase [Methylocapsa sp. S129]
MENVVDHMRHSKERLYGRLMMIFGAAIWGLFAVGLVLAAVTGAYSVVAVLAVYIVYGLLIWLAIIIGKFLTRAYIYGHYVLIGPQQFPYLHQMVVEGAAAVKLPEAPKAFVYNSGGLINAFALRLIGGRYIWLTSALIDADTDAQVRFVIGHELGHHAAGHLDWRQNLLKLPGWIVPFLGAAYSRSRELTCDRVGAYLAQDLDAARSGLQVLACGSARLNSAMNPQAFEEQEAMVPPIAGFIVHIFSFYPRLSRRVEEVTRYFQPANPATS